MVKRLIVPFMFCVAYQLILFNFNFIIIIIIKKSRKRSEVEN